MSNNNNNSKQAVIDIFKNSIDRLEKINSYAKVILEMRRKQVELLKEAVEQEEVSLEKMRLEHGDESVSTLVRFKAYRELFSSMIKMQENYIDAMNEYCGGCDALGILRENVSNIENGKYQTLNIGEDGLQNMLDLFSGNKRNGDFGDN